MAERHKDIQGIPAFFSISEKTIHDATIHPNGNGQRDGGTTLNSLTFPLLAELETGSLHAHYDRIVDEYLQRDKKHVKKKNRNPSKKRRRNAQTQFSY